MPHVNLSTLNASELRNLLDSARSRGQPTLAYDILQEMAVRRDQTGERRGLFGRRDTGSRVVELDLGDSLEAKDEVPPLPAWRLPTDPGPMRAEADPDLEPDDELRLAPAAYDIRRPPPPRRVRLPGPGFVAGTAVGAVAGAAFGVWAVGFARPDAPPPAAAVQTAMAPVVPAIQPPAPIVTASGPAVSPVPEVAPQPVAELPAPEVVPEPAPAPAPVELAQAPEPAVTAVSGCTAAPTPADQAICEDPELQRLQQELRQAYAVALDAHAERALLRQRQLAWAETRNPVADPERLARLYHDHIHKLNAATAEARRQR